MDRTATLGNELIHRTLKEVETSYYNRDRKLPDSLVVVYTNLSKEVISVIDSSIKSISSLSEKDTTIKLQQSIVHLFTGVRNLFQQAFPLVIEILKNGFANTRPEAGKSFENFSNETKDLQFENTNLKNKIDEFIKIHNISDEELKKAGAIMSDENGNEIK